jgi:hypothetical protein
MNEISSHILKLSGSGELDGPLEHSKTFAIGAEISVEDGGLRDNQDRTHDKIWRGKLIRAQVHTQTGEVRTKDKSSQSVKLRRAILAHRPNDSPLDEDAWYEYCMGAIRHYIEPILDLIQKYDSNN